MDQEIRNKLRNVVTQCRKLLEDDIRDSLEGKFGIFVKKDQVTADPNASMTHLSEEEQAARKDILDHFAHISARGFKPKDSLDQLIREIAFTHLNRLCAYKMMEAREVYVGGQKFREAVSRGFNSNGVKFYLADHAEDLRLFETGHQDIAYRHFLDWLGGLLSDEIGVLFNPNDPANRLYPRQKTLDEVLDLLNEGGIKSEETDLREQWPKIWSQDETIGWVYQYFTPKEMRDAARDPKKGGSQAPRNSYELAFRNQFFTPRYVVEFLTDNTLGRIWYEMREGNTKLKDQCRYMVRRPTEMFLKKGEQPPQDAAEAGLDLSQQQLLKLPVHVPHRPKKDPRELKILDPACGSGHFLLYCFDLLLTIYEEAYADAELGSALQKNYPKLEELRRDVPRLILAHNLHGIDIDLRASQIAALALWLRCQRDYQDLGLRKDRPRITRSNFVCAEPMPGEEHMLKEFVSQLEPRLLGQLVEVVFDKMKLAGEAGSLLTIELELRDAVAQARMQWLAGPVSSQRSLFDDDKLVARQQRFDFSGITDAQFFEQAEAKVVDALRQYAENCQNAQRLQRRLFTDDAVRGFAFVDLCHKRFDVVLMNPPFGEPSIPSRQYLYATIPSSSQDLFAAFVARWIPTLFSSGRLGALTNRLGLFKDLLDAWRTDFLLGATSRLQDVADLGYDVLDEALVEAAAYIIEIGDCICGDNNVLFVTVLDRPDKQAALVSTLRAINEGRASERGFCHNLRVFMGLPKKRFSYWCSHGWLKRFSALPQLSTLGVIAKKGLETGKDFEQLRLFWEVAASDLKPFERWTVYSKGGQYRPIHADLHLTFDWTQADRARRTSNSDLYGKAGLTYTERTTSSFAARVLPSRSLFGPAGPGIFDTCSDQPWGLLGLLNSSVVSFYLELLVGGGDTSAAGTAARHFMPTLIEMLPAPEELRQLTAALREPTEALHGNLLQHRIDETSLYFSVPYLDGSTLSQCASRRWSYYESTVLSALDTFVDIDAAVFAAYTLSEEELHDLRTFLGRPLPTGTEPSEQSVQLILERFSQQPQEGGDDDEDLDATIQSRALKKLCHIADQRYETLSVQTGLSPRTIAKVRAEHGLIPPAEVLRVAQDCLSYAVGCTLGRWDIRFAVGTSSPPDLPLPFAAVPCSQPGMLVEVVTQPTLLATDRYPIRFDKCGLLVDDPEHHDDIVPRVREVLEVIWKEAETDAVEKEACEILGVKELRDYFRKPGKGGFWDDHIARYSKSRRKAPIYWLLQSSKKTYALWLYYHRLDRDLLFKALVNYVEPKIRLEDNRLDNLRSQKAAAGESGKEVKRLAKEVERQEDFLSDLRDFEDKLRRTANLHLDPDLNDGVVLNIAPLHELVPWKQAANYWKELLEGKYEWSSIGKQLREKGLLK